MITEEENKNRDDEKFNSRSPMNVMHPSESSSKSHFSEESSHRIDINFGFTKQPDVSPGLDEKVNNVSVIDIKEEEIKNNQEMIADAIKFEIMKRMQKGANKISSAKVGGKGLNQIVAHRFNPLLSQQNNPLIHKDLTLGKDVSTTSEIREGKLSVKQSKKVLLGFGTSRQQQTMNNQEEGILEFNFEEPISLREEKMEGTNKKKYGISIWKLNRGQQAYQIREHMFNLLPLTSKFFISHDSKSILVFLMNENDQTDTIDRIRILDIETLQIQDEIKASKFYEIQASELEEAALIWNGSYIYVQTKESCFFINVKEKNIDYSFDLTYDGNSSSKIMRHALFRENESLAMYTVVQSQRKNGTADQESYALYRVSITRAVNIFENKYFFMTITQNSALEYNRTIGYNKYLSQIVFPGEQIFYVFYVKTKQLKPYRNVQNCQVNKNSYLNEHVWIAYNDDNYDTYTISTQNLIKKYLLSDCDLDDWRLGDITKEKSQNVDQQQILAIGKKGGKEASSRIMINVTSADSTEPFINYIQETSDYIFAYPVIVYCKGNAELFIQSLHQPERLIKLDLEDQFVCFVDLNPYVKLKPLHMALGLSEGNQQFRKYESIAFLTQNEDQIFLNILEYTPYGYDKQYTIYKSTQSIQRPKTSYGNIMKAVFQKVKHRECKDNDYILILQFRSHILIRSFFNFFVLNIDKCKFTNLNALDIYKFPMIYLPSKDKILPDVCFFITKDGYSTKVERIGFNGKEFKDPISTSYELKTQSIFIFQYHEGYFYIMDDTLSLKQFIYDKRTQKFKYLKMFEFSIEYRDILAQPVDYDDIQVTEKGVMRSTLFIPFFECNIYNKDINLVKTDPILSIPENDLFSGPKKLHGTQYLLYIARGDQGILQAETVNSLDNIEDEMNEESLQSKRSKQEEIEHLGDSMRTDSHNVPIHSGLKSRLNDSLNDHKQMVENTKHSFIASINDSTNHKEIVLNENVVYQRAKSIHRPSKSIPSAPDQNGIIKHSKTLKKINSPRESPKFSQNQKIDAQSVVNIQNKQDFTSETQQAIKKRKSFLSLHEQQQAQTLVSEEVYAWIVPYLDSNIIHFTHNLKENSNPKYQVTFSTFLNGQDEILCQINQVFYLYSKNGAFLYQLEIEKRQQRNSYYFQQNNFQLENMSTNLNYFLFYDAVNKVFEIYRLIRDRVDDETLRQKLTKQKYSRIKTQLTMSKSKDKDQQNQQAIDRYCQPYMLQYVKSVQEYGSVRVIDDYFNQRHISDQGEVYQLVSTSQRERRQSSYVQKFDNNQDNINDLPTQRKKSYVSLPQLALTQEKDEEKNIFEFYIDEEDKGEDFKERFKLIKEHLKTNNSTQEEMNQFGFMIIGNYLFIKRALRLEYLKIFDKNPETGLQTYIGNKLDENAVMVHLILDNNAQIQRLVSTVNTSPELVQIIVSDEHFLYVITWDINANIEHQMMQILKKFNFNSGHVICKGMTERHNYIPIDNQFYDLYFGLPFKFFQNINKRLPKKIKMNMNERKFSYFNKEYLDLFENNKVYKSYTYLDLCYLRALQNLNRDQIDQSHIQIQHLHVRIQGLTFFSLIAQNFNLLKDVFLEIKKQDEMLIGGSNNIHSELNSNSAKMVFMHILYPSFHNQSAFDVAMHRKSPKSIEIMLEMLSTLPNYSLSKYFMHHFSELFQMELVAFQNFLSCCLFQLPQMREIRMLKWIHHQDEFYIDYHTSYLGDNFYKQIQRNNVSRFLSYKKYDFSDFDREFTETQQNRESLQSENLQDMRTLQPNINQGLSEEQMLNKGNQENMQWNRQFEVGEVKRVETCAVEFDWIFRGKNAISFIEHLAHNANDSIFGIDTIKIIVLFLWDRFFYHIRNKIFIPFLFYFFIFLFEVTYVYEQRNKANLSRQDLLETGESYTEDEELAWRISDYTLISVLLCLWFYFFMIECRQAIRLKKDYFTDLWNWLDMSSMTINLSYFICALTDVSPERNRVQSSCAIILMWLKLLYFLRLFASTAALIRMIVEIMGDMIVFTIIYFIAIFGFANAFFILSFNLDQEAQDHLFGGNLFMAITYTYRAGLGDFHTDEFDTAKDKPLWYFLFIVQTLFIQVVLLNLLIAIMGDTFDKVTEKREESKLREICEMISDYEGIMDREKEFKNSKYIIVTKLEKAQTNLNTDWEGRLSSLKSCFQQIVSDLKKDSKQMNENLREEIIGNNKAMEQKFMDMQSLIMKQSSQVTLALKKIDKVSHNVKKMSKRSKNAEGELVEEDIDIAQHKEKNEEDISENDTQVQNEIQIK